MRARIRALMVGLLADAIEEALREQHKRAMRDFENLLRKQQRVGAAINSAASKRIRR